MKFRIPDLEPIKSGMFIAGFITAGFFVGVSFVVYLSIDLPAGTQVQVLATVLGSFGTLLLAIATFINIFQTNRRLDLKEKDREKPLIIDELAHVIQPAINSLENNLQQMEDSDNPGCAFDWVYLDGSTLFSGANGPRSVQTPDSLPMARLAADDRELYATLRVHDNYTERVAEAAGELHDELKVEIKRLLELEGIDNQDQSLKVVTSAVIKELDHFGESHDLYDFWESHRDDLIEYADKETETPLEEVKAGERVYRKYIEETLRPLKQRKAKLKQEYGISEEEITLDSDGPILNQ
jgi:hypothetical protein